MAIQHTIGEPFRGKGYDLPDLTETVRIAYSNNNLWFFPENLVRMEKLGINMVEVERCIEHGSVVQYEVTPHGRGEIRLEMTADSGDMHDLGLRPIIWMDSKYDLCCADIKEVK